METKNKTSETQTPGNAITHSDTPTNANAECVGPSSESAGKASSCEGCPNQAACGSAAFNSPEATAKANAEVQAIRSCLANVSHVVLVLSGKGGVGKSTIAAQLCHTLATQGYAVGLLDVDLCGPSAPRMVLGDDCVAQTIHKSGSGAWTPVYSVHNVAVMSISFMLQDSNQAVVWRGPRKNSLIEQFLTQVDWTGETDGLDYLIVDTPPGTSDEHISTVQYLQKANAVSGAVVVTTPEEVSLADVRKELNFCQKTKVPVLGIVENMGQLQTTISKLKFTDPTTGQDCSEQILAVLREKCPEVLSCDVTSELFASASPPVETTADGLIGGAIGGAVGMAQAYQVPFWGRLPLDPDLLLACEQGRPFVQVKPNSVASQALKDFCQKLVSRLPVDMEMQS
ncbi:hypothetical protein ACA910_000842 [Epithemia clementina (nom. ined.)]